MNVPWGRRGQIGRGRFRVKAEFGVPEDVACHRICYHDIAHGEHCAIGEGDASVVEHYSNQGIGCDGDKIIKLPIVKDSPGELRQVFSRDESLEISAGNMGISK